VVGGALALIAGFFVLQYPVSSGLAFVWILGAWGIIAGAIEIARALSIPSRAEQALGGAPAPTMTAGHQPFGRFELRPRRPNKQPHLHVAQFFMSRLLSPNPVPHISHNLNAQSLVLEKLELGGAAALSRRPGSRVVHRNHSGGMAGHSA
jgi:hypothetical protein